MVPLYLQLLGVGLLWVTFHCAGMCGPIMAGLVTHNTVVPRQATVREAFVIRARGVLSYQAGRAAMYALLGGLAGAFGALIEEQLRAFTGTATLLGAAIVIGLALYQLLPGLHRLEQRASDIWVKQGRWLGRTMRRVGRLLPGRGPAKMALFGVLMSMLPCMLMFWVLSLSISSSSIVHGAVLMVLLVVMTTPVLLMAGCSSSLVPERWRARFGPVVPWALLLSGVWMGLIGLASTGVIDHVHLPFRLAGELYTFMLW